MKKIKNLIALLIIVCVVATAQAQELKFKVTIATPKLQTADPKVFESLRGAMESFLNSQKWTEDIFEQEERINCIISLTINEELSATRFRADCNIQASRPVYGSSYETPILTHLDKDFIFDYEQYQPVIYTRNTFNDNLTSMLSFYSYIILGLDYDSFAPLGGDANFQTALEIEKLVPVNLYSTYKGWDIRDNAGRNRTAMIESIINPRVRPYRTAMYDYHRKGLDIMSNNVDAGKNVMLQSIEELDKVNQSFPNAMILQMFANAKGAEVVEIFKESTPQQKSRLLTVMTRIDPPGAARYREVGF